MGRYSADTGGTAVTTDAAAVGRWEDASSGLRHVLQATAGNRPTYRTATPSIRFDGTDDYLRYVGSRVDTTGSLMLAFTTGATAFATRGVQVIFSSADEGSANNWFEVGITADGRMYVESNAAGSKRTVYGSTYMDVSTAYTFVLTFDDTDYYMQLSGAEQNPMWIQNFASAFAWLGDVSGADNIVIGGTFTSGGLVRPFLGDVMEVALYSGDIS